MGKSSKIMRVLISAIIADTHSRIDTGKLTPFHPASLPLNVASNFHSPLPSPLLTGQVRRNNITLKCPHPRSTMAILSIISTVAYPYTFWSQLASQEKGWTL